MESIESWHDLEISNPRLRMCIDHSAALKLYCVPCREYFCKQCSHEHRLENILDLIPQIYEYCEELAEENAHFEEQF